MPIPISTVPQLAAVRTKLESLGLTTVEGVREAARLVPGEAAAFLGQPLAPLLATVPLPAGGPAAPVPSFPLGVNLAAIPAQLTAFKHLAGLVAPPPSSANNIALMGTIRNQGTRFTCVGFSSCAVREAYVALKNGGTPPSPLSPQYLYFECKERDGDPAGHGTYVQVAFETLKADGVCRETVWPYDPVPRGTEGGGPEPLPADADALLHRVPDFAALPPTSVVELQAQLARGLCVAISIPVFQSWYGSAVTMSTGAITLPFPDEVPLGGHAVCVVGYRVDPAKPGGGVFVVRNSWGTAWGESSSDGPGYGTLPFASLAAYGREAYCIQG